MAMPDNHLIKTGLDNERVFDGKLLSVRRDRVRLPDGGAAMREFIVHPGAALIVAELADGRLVMERQYRYPVGRVILEFPAGKLDTGETALATAQRELIEEAGYTAKFWMPIATLHPNVGYSTEIIDVFLARELTHIGANLDQGEFLDVVLMSEADLLDSFDRGALTDGKSIAALFAWQRYRAQTR